MNSALCSGSNRLNGQLDYVVHGYEAKRRSKVLHLQGLPKESMNSCQPGGKGGCCGATKELGML
jgi:hypothetical protein